MATKDELRKQALAAVNGATWNYNPQVPEGMTRTAIAGMTGLVYDANGAAMFAAAPRIRHYDGRRQCASVYTLADATAYAAAYAALSAARDESEIRSVYALADAIGAASLRNEVVEDVEAALHDYLPQEMADPLAPVFAWCMAAPAGVTVDVKPKGCIWVKGETMPHRDDLKALGFRWSPKKSAWWLDPANLAA